MNVGRGSILLLVVGLIRRVVSSQLNVRVKRGHDDPESEYKQRKKRRLDEEQEACFLSSILCCASIIILRAICGLLPFVPPHVVQWSLLLLPV